jgi:hypothetical protein
MLLVLMVTASLLAMVRANNVKHACIEGFLSDLGVKKIIRSFG